MVITDSKETLAVKPLEWEPVSDRTDDADGMGKLYRVTRRETGAILKNSRYQDGDPYPSVEAAKAAAQADYERRIRSALVASAPVSPDADLMERMAKALSEIVWSDAKTDDFRDVDGERHVHLDITLSEWEAARTVLADYKAMRGKAPVQPGTAAP